VSTFVSGLYDARVKPARRRRRLRVAVLLGPLATAAGRTLRAVVAGSRYLPGLGAGVAFVVGGFVLAPWVGWVVLGVVLLALDRRTARDVEAPAS
jgi:hypothetical protein